jgi:hypothetical protein
MKRAQPYRAIGRPAILACTLAFVVGCGGSESAESDPVARVQTESEAKNAMLATSKKESKGTSQQQSTRNAMEAGGRQQRSGKK